ncbi:MAG TPA: DUF371 domain-containing protein [Geobacterales bacterium]|nr:DUF371 domain-containing protein [Geobacterales bacterium]
MLLKEEFKAYGHRLISALHPTTFEITKESHLTKRGDCIIAIKSEKACLDLDLELKKLIRNEGSRIRIILCCEGYIEEIEASGSPYLLLTNPVSIVVRKSKYIDDRTLAILSNKAARDLDRKFVKEISKDEAVIEITIEVYNEKV